MDKATPLQRIVNINRPFIKAGDRAKSLREYIPGAWPTWGEFLDEMTTYAKLKRDNEALLGALKEIRARERVDHTPDCDFWEGGLGLCNCPLPKVDAAIKRAEEGR